MMPLLSTAQVPTIHDPVPSESYAFSLETANLWEDPLTQPLVMQVTINEKGECESPQEILPGKMGRFQEVKSQLHKLKFLPGRWGAELVPRPVYLIFTSKLPRGITTDWSLLLKDHPTLPIYHFHSRRGRNYQELSDYMWYEHIHRHLYPPVGYEESDEEGNFTETITHTVVPYADEIPDPDSFMVPDSEPRPVDISILTTDLPLNHSFYMGVEPTKTILRVLVDKEGVPSRFQVKRVSDHPLITEKLVANLRKVRFIPAVLNREVVYAWVTLPVEICLKR